MDPIDHFLKCVAQDGISSQKRFNDSPKIKSRQRKELRYFGERCLYNTLITSLEKNGFLEEIFPCKVTQSLYFTKGKNFDYAFPENGYLRLRNYIPKIDPTILLDGDSSYLFEFKSKENKDNTNNKCRIAADMSSSFVKVTPEFLSKLKTFQYELTYGTQTVRRHFWSEDTRITIDEDLFFFLFEENIEYSKYTPIGSTIGHLGQIKLETKYPKEIEISPLQELISSTGFTLGKRGYIEEKIRECHKKKLYK